MSGETGLPVYMGWAGSAPTRTAGARSGRSRPPPASVRGALADPDPATRSCRSPPASPAARLEHPMVGQQGREGQGGAGKVRVGGAVPSACRARKYRMRSAHCSTTAPLSARCICAAVTMRYTMPSQVRSGRVGSGQVTMFMAKEGKGRAGAHPIPWRRTSWPPRRRSSAAYIHTYTQPHPMLSWDRPEWDSRAEAADLCAEHGAERPETALAAQVRAHLEAQHLVQHAAHSRRIQLARHI